MKNKLKSKAKQIQMICDYLLKECEHDQNLAERVLLENKTVDKMYKYILATVKKEYKDEIVNQCVYVAPEDVYSMAIHYFIEDDETLKNEHPNIVTEIKTKTKAKSIKKENEQQMSLFDLGDM